jgi:hypothetical protein
MGERVAQTSPRLFHIESSNFACPSQLPLSDHSSRLFDDNAFQLVLITIFVICHVASAGQCALAVINTHFQPI